jgi:Transposase IS116/IS110/IS902 family
VVKHAGLCPRDNASGHHQGKATISGRGRPELRLAARRAVWAAMLNNSVLKGQLTHLTTRQDNKLAAQQARAACAARLLRWLHVVVTRRVPWNPAIAAGEATTTPQTRAAQPFLPAPRAGRARTSLEQPTPRRSMGSPTRPSPARFNAVGNQTRLKR